MNRLLFARCVAVGSVALVIALDSRRHAVNNLTQIATDPNGFLAHQRRLQHPGLAYNLTLWVIGVGLIALAIEGISRLVLRAIPASPTARQGNPRQCRGAWPGVDAALYSRRVTADEVVAPRR